MTKLLCIVGSLLLAGCMSPWSQVMQCERVCEDGVEEVNTRGLSVVCYCVEDTRYIVCE